MAISGSLLLSMLVPSLQGRLPAFANCSPHIASKSQTGGANGNVFFPPFNALCIMASPKIVSENELIAGPFDSPNLLMRSTLSCQSEQRELLLCDHMRMKVILPGSPHYLASLLTRLQLVLVCPSAAVPEAAASLTPHSPGKQPLSQTDCFHCLTATSDLSGCLISPSSTRTRKGLLRKQGSWNGE